MWKGAFGPNTGPARPKPYCSSLLLRLAYLAYVPVAEFFRNYFVCLFNKSFWFLLSPHSAISVTEHFSFTFIYGYSSSLLSPSLISSREPEVIDGAHGGGFPACHWDKLSSAPITGRPEKQHSHRGGSLLGQLGVRLHLLGVTQGEPLQQILLSIKRQTPQSSKADDLKYNKTLGKSLTEINGKPPAGFTLIPSCTWGGIPIRLGI